MEVFHKGSDPPLSFSEVMEPMVHIWRISPVCVPNVYHFYGLGWTPPPLTEYFHNIAKKCTLQVYSVSQKNDPWRNMTIGGICSLFVRYLSTCCTNKGYQGMWGHCRTLFDVSTAPHWWILEEKTDIAWGLYLVSSDGRGGHPLTVGQNVKDHLCSIVPWPIRWQEYDTVQMILGILGHRQRVSSSPGI